MAFLSRRKVYTPRINRDRNPDSVEFYPSKNPNTLQKSRTGASYSAEFKSLTLPYKYMFQLRVHGRPFGYQGIITKAYSIKMICRLFCIHRTTLFSWIEKGIMPQPFIKVVGDSIFDSKNYWFYHQVQPVYVWYIHLRSRGMKRVSADETCLFSVLQRNMRRSRIRFEKLLGIEQVDKYAVEAGRYGVIPLDR